METLRGEAALALDTEFLTERTYFPKLCLIQIATPSVLATVDPLACEDLAPLGELLAEQPTLVVHAGTQDLAILQRRFGMVPDRVFDTQIAAAFLGFGHSIGYARLVEACCEVSLKRSQAYTDWSKRPLDSRQLDYALDDVRHLLPIRDQLTARLDSQQRQEWANEEFERARRVAISETDPRDQWRRVSGKRAKSGRQMAILQELAAWREEEAQRRDIPRQRVVPDRVLLEIARRVPKNAREMEGMRGLHPRELQRSGTAIVDVVQRGAARPQSSWPSSPAPARLDDDPKVAVAAALTDVYLKTRVRDLGLAPQLLANRQDLETLIRAVANGSVGGGDAARNDPEEPAIRLLEGWRRDVAGNDVLRLLDGQLAIRVKVKRRAVEVLIEDSG